MKLVIKKPAPKPLALALKPLKLVLPRPVSQGSAQTREPVQWAGRDPEWYQALGKLAGIAPDEAYRIHYPGKYGPALPASKAKMEAAQAAGKCGADAILAEMKRLKHP